MADYSSLASDFDELPAKSGPASNPYSDLASEFNTAPNLVNKKTPTFQTSDPASMRRQLVAAGDANVVAAFDKQYPGYAPHDSVGGGRGNTPASAYAQQPQSAQATQTDPYYNPIRNSKAPDPLKLVAHVATGLGASAYGGLKGGAMSLGDIASGLWHGKSWSDAVDQGVNAGTAAVRDAQEKYIYNADPNSASGEIERQFDSKYNPLNWPGVAGSYVGGKLADSGYPALGAATNAGVTVLGGPAVFKGARMASSSLADLMKPAADIPSGPRIEPTMTRGPEPQPAPAGQANAPSPSQASTVGNNPSPTIAQTGSTVTPTDALKSPKDLPLSERAARAKALMDVGLTDSRDSAVLGDNRARAVEYQMSKFDEPAGQAAAQQFTGEVQALGDHVRNMIDKAGGTVGTDQAAQYARGQTIVRPIQALRDWFDQKASSLYQAADEKAQGQPVTLGEFGRTLNDPSFMTQPDRVLLRDAAAAFAKKSGMTIGEDGSLNGTALQAETFRKWLNKERTNSNGGFVEALKDSMDDDVGRAAGGPIYDQARQLWQLRQQTLGDPKGISSLLDEEGTNRTVPFERVADNITKLPQDQFAHIVKTLQSMPPELQGVSNAALGEIKSQFYNKMLDSASTTRGGNGRPFWNGTGVKNVIRDNSGKLGVLLSPDELSSLDALHKAGDILSFDPSYPGAAAQAQNAVKRGLLSNMVSRGMTGAGAAGGAAFGAPGAGALLGSVVGDKAAAALAQRQALRDWNKGTVNLKDIAGGAR